MPSNDYNLKEVTKNCLESQRYPLCWQMLICDLGFSALPSVSIPPHNPTVQPTVPSLQACYHMLQVTDQSLCLRLVHHHGLGV